MKKLLCLLVLIGISINAISQSQWVPFTDPNPSAPIITLQSSSSQQVKYSLQIPGMYEETLVVGSETFKRLSIPKTGSWGDSGYPELPAISNLIAIPECDSVIISYLVTDSVVLNNYNVYPRPEIVEDSLTGTLVEQFTKNDSVYQLNIFMPEIDYEMLSEGYFRNQRTASVAAYPIKYNPVTQQLIAYTSIEISITFQNAQGEVNVDNGLFSNITKSTLLNYNLTNDQLPPYPVGTPGSVTWMTLAFPDDADDIVADYLIVTDDPFFTPHSSALQTFANHRAAFNGFDVVIVNVDNILNLNFEYDPPSNPYWISERKIRSFIKRVYDGQNAAHTYDGYLAFVCIVGDSYPDLYVDGVPTSYDPDPTFHPAFPNVTWSANDYYYSCVTKNGNNWDLFGDIFIGRLCADDESDLFNIVTKIKHNENEYTFENWRTINTLAYGGAIGGPPNVDHQYFCVDLKNWVETICNPAYSVTLIDVEITGPSNWKDEYINHINSPGSNIVIHFSHGWVQSWANGLSLDYKMANMSNNGKYPFVISQSCYTGYFTGAPGTPDCMGERMLLYSPDSGYVAYLGSWREAGGNLTQSGQFPRSLQERIFSAIYQNLSHVLGEAILEARIGVLDPNISPGFNPVHFQHNLFGDPALNLMALGYEITQNTTLPPDPPLPQITTISTKVYVRPGITLSLEAGAVLEFSDNGQLIIENGAILEIGNNVIIKGQTAINKIRIEGVICGPGGNINNPVPINNLTLVSLPGTTWKGIEYYNPDLIVKMIGGSVSDCQLSGELIRLELSASILFSNSNITLNQSGILVDGCTFNNANILLTNNNESGVFAQVLNSTFQNSSADALIRFEHIPSYTIQNCTISYAQGTGVDLYYCGNRNGQYLIKNNTIQKSGSSQDMSWGIKVYSTFADIENNYITNNRYGIASLNQSQVQLIGNPSASTNAETQRIVHNFQNQVRATDNSFPCYFHYNIIQNTPTGSTYLVFYDPVFPDPPPIESTFNVKCNCFDNANPTPQLYPTGWYSWSIWCPPAFCQFDDQGGGEFETAVSSMEAGDYTTAETQFKTVIETYPETSYARESAKKLIPLKNLSDKDFNGLKLYYDSTSALHEDSLTDHLVYRLKNKCDVEMENYQDAINWFESDILNPVSVDDSVFSLIDLSDTYILMEADSNLKSSLSTYTGSSAQYKPKNREEYTMKRNEWINLLFKDDVFIPDDLQPGNTDEPNMVKQNIPNPFSASTEVSFTLSESSKVSIFITNLLGQVVQKLERSYQSEGKYMVTINLTGKPDGIYFITLYANQKELGKIKAVKSK